MSTLAFLLFTLAIPTSASILQSTETRLQWDHAGGAGIVYRVYLGVAPDVQPDETPDAVVASTEWAITAPPGVWYAVVTAKSDVAESPKSNEVSFTSPFPPIFTSPLEWSYDTGRTDIREFRIYAGNTSGVRGPLAATITYPALTWTVSLPAGTYFAVATAVSIEGIESPASNEVTFIVPDAPTNLRIAQPQ